MNKRTIIILGLVAGLLGVLIASHTVPFVRVEARPIQCKHLNSECNVNDSDHPCCAGLSCVPYNNHSDNGKCLTNPTPTPTLTPTNTPTPTPKECEEDCITPTPTEVTPTPTEVMPTQEPQQSSSVSSNAGSPSSSTDSPSCGNPQPPMVQDLWYSDYKVSGNTAELTLHWGPNQSFGKVNIAYGEKINTWNYGALNVDDTGSFVIGSLKPNQTYWFQIAYINGCASGLWSHPVDP